jgi:GPH family glycoside/pentoside/hexuronide:cation symporter
MPAPHTVPHSVAPTAPHVAFASTAPLLGGRLWPWALFAALIAAAGLPIYIHAPKVYVDQYGVSLAALGGVLALLRMIDVVQDPLLGWLAEVTKPQRGAMVAGASALLGVSMIGLFAVTPPMAPLAWFALNLTVLFSAYSFLTIVFYAQGVERVAMMPEQAQNGVPRDAGQHAAGHLALAGWRETGSLLGVSLAAVAPVLLAGFFVDPFAAFAYGFAAFAVLATVAMHGAWKSTAQVRPRLPGLQTFRPVLADKTARKLLLLALINSAPVAVTSTLFLFFVESKLGLAGYEGAFLLLFFLSAAICAPVWTHLGTRFEEKPVLLAGMTLSIVAFLGALSLDAGQAIAFGVICFASGAALGADMVLLPAIFARRLAVIGQSSETSGGEAAAFGLWSFVSKLSLAIAAATLLPTLQLAGFQSGQTNSDATLATLTLLYAGLPCALKLCALLLLGVTKLEKE